MDHTMAWNDFRLRYLDFVASILQAQIATRAALKLLQDYPKTLPKTWQKRIWRGSNDLLESLLRTLQDLKRTPNDLNRRTSSGKPRKRKAKTDPLDLLDPTLLVMLTNSSAGRDLLNVSFPNILWTQQLVMAFAFLDAFFSDCLRVICRAQPNVMKSKRTIEWETLIDLKAWDQVLQHMIESHVFAFGMKTLSDRIDSMRNDYGLVLQLPQGTESALVESELVRHLVIHSGGRISAEYIRRTKTSGRKIGETIQVTQELADGTANNMIDFAGALYSDISVSFFKKEPQSITGVLKFSPRGERAT